MPNQSWYDSILTYILSMVKSLTNIETYLKALSEIKSIAGSIVTHLTNIRSQLSTVKNYSKLTNASLNKIRSDGISVKGSITAEADYLTERIKTQRIKVGTEPTPLSLHPLPGRKLLVLNNNSNATIYYGESDVSGGQGMILLAGQPVSIHARASCRFYAVVSSSDVAKNIRILEGK